MDPARNQSLPEIQVPQALIDANRAAMADMRRSFSRVEGFSGTPWPRQSTEISGMPVRRSSISAAAASHNPQLPTLAAIAEQARDQSMLTTRREILIAREELRRQVISVVWRMSNGETVSEEELEFLRRAGESHSVDEADLVLEPRLEVNDAAETDAVNMFARFPGFTGTTFDWSSVPTQVTEAEVEAEVEVEVEREIEQPRQMMRNNSQTISIVPPSLLSVRLEHTQVGEIEYRIFGQAMRLRQLDNSQIISIELTPQQHARFEEMHRELHIQALPAPQRVQQPEQQRAGRKHKRLCIKSQPPFDRV